MRPKTSESFSLAELSHNLLNPLQGVLGSTKLLLETELNKSQREHADTILISAEALLAEVLHIIDQPPRPAGVPRPPANLELLKGKKILLVEDDNVNQKVTSKTLEKYGLVVEVASNGKHALDILRAHADPQSFFELIVMDCEMPIMDGYETTKMIRKYPYPIRDIPIIAMTGNNVAGDREKCLEAGMNDYVSKPFDTQELLLAIEAAIKFKEERAKLQYF